MCGIEIMSMNIVTKGWEQQRLIPHFDYFGGLGETEVTGASAQNGI